MSIEGREKALDGREQHDTGGNSLNGEMPKNGYFLAEGHAGEGEGEYRALFEGAPVGYFTLNSQGLILSVNPMGAKQLRSDCDTVTGTCFFNYVSQKDHKQFGDHLRRIFTSNFPQTI